MSSSSKWSAIIIIASELIVTIKSIRILAHFPLNTRTKKHHDKRNANNEEENVNKRARPVTHRTTNLVNLEKMLLA